MSGKRIHRGKLKQINDRDFAPQRLLQFCLHLSDCEGMSAKIEEVIVHADAWNPQCILPRGYYDALDLGPWPICWIRFGADLLAH